MNASNSVKLAPHALDTYYDLLAYPEHGRFVIWRYCDKTQLIYHETSGQTRFLDEFMSYLLDGRRFAVYAWAQDAFDPDGPELDGDKIIYFELNPKEFFDMEVPDLATLLRLTEATHIMTKSLRGVHTFVVPECTDYSDATESSRKEAARREWLSTPMPPRRFWAIYMLWALEETWGVPIDLHSELLMPERVFLGGPASSATSSFTIVNSPG